MQCNDTSIMCWRVGSSVEGELIYDHSDPVSVHPVGCQVHGGCPCISVCVNSAGADEIPPSATALHLSRTG